MTTPAFWIAKAQLVNIIRTMFVKKKVGARHQLKRSLEKKKGNIKSSIKQNIRNGRMHLVGSPPLSPLAFGGVFHAHIYRIIVPSSFQPMGIKHTSNTLLPLACSDYGMSGVKLRLCLRHRGSRCDRGHLGRWIILNRVMRCQGLMYVLYGAIQIHWWRVCGYGARVDGKGHVPLTRWKH